MRIEKNTTKEDVKRKHLEALVRLYSQKESADRGLELELMKRVLGIRELIATKKNVIISLEETLEFLNNATSYSEFQIWLGDLQERDLSKLDRIKALLARTSDSDILKIFEVEQNYDENNLASIDRMIEETEFDQAYGMQVDESGNGKTPTITKESSKALAKSLIR